MADFPTPKAVATVVLPEGSKDPAEVMSSGGFLVRWGDKSVTKFKERKIRHLKEEGLCLPTLYLHFLHQDFRTDGMARLDHSLRSGNDMSEVIVKVPPEYLSSGFAEQCGDLQDQVEIVTNALKSQGEVLVMNIRQNKGEIDPETLFFSLKTARPKAGVSLDKKAFGIPENADQYLFVNNHASVVYFDEPVTDAFNALIGGLPDCPSPAAKKYHTFLKVFYEGGFAYNKKDQVSQGSYVPVNVGTAAMDVQPAFAGQIGIGTGFPYLLPAPFLQFTETVPISISAIREMSERHGRYGLAFTRTVFVWEGEDWKKDGTLDFCSILPHGGFFYVPDKMSDHQQKGGLVYAFGESRNDEGDLSLSS